MSDFMREEFEIAFVARCKKKGEFARLDRFDDGRYEYLDASDAWWGWHASRECLVIELPEKTLITDSSDMLSIGNNGAINKCRDAIRAAGVKTK